MTTAIIIDPHLLIRKGVIRMLQEQTAIRFVADVGDGVEGLAAFRKHSPELVITETTLPQGRGMEVIKTVKEGKGKVVALSTQADASCVLEALRAGALAYVLKQGPVEDLFEAISAVGSGEAFLSSPLRASALRMTLNKAPKGDAFSQLTSRERSVLRLAAEGLPSVEIGNELFISRRTVETHRANLMRKIRVNSQTDLIKFAVRHGVISV